MIKATIKNNMKKTCMNCKYFCGCLEDPNIPHLHIHNFCTKWNLVLGSHHECKLNKTINELAEETHNLCCAYDDLEIGEACCYLFEKGTNTYTDDFYDANKEINLKILEGSIENILRDDDSESPFTREYLEEIRKEFLSKDEK